MKKIDVHCHTTNRPIPDSINTDASLDALTRLMDKHQIVHTIVLATYFPMPGTGISNYRMRHWLQNRSNFSMFGSLDTEYYFFQGLNELQELAQNQQIKGIKLYTAYQDIDFHSEKFQQVANLARDYGLPLMFHGGVSYNLWKQLSIEDILALSITTSPSHGNEPYKTPQDFAFVAQQYPDVPVIVSHLCKPFFQSMIDVLNNFDNVFTDISGILDSKRDTAYRTACVETVKRFIGECGPHKILFGTDFPVQTHEDSIYFIEEAMITYPLEAKQQVYFDNAKQLIFGDDAEIF